MSHVARRLGFGCALAAGTALFVSVAPVLSAGSAHGLGAGALLSAVHPDVDPAGVSVPVSRPVQLSDELQEVAERFGEALRQGNAESLTRLFSESGIRLRLEGLDRSALSVRQVNAALRDFLRAYQPGQVRLVRAAPVEGNPGRGFAQLHWETRVVGTSHPVVHAVFLGLVREGESWRVDEFRLLP